MTDMADNLRHCQAEITVAAEILSDIQRQTLLEWLSSVDPSRNYNQAIKDREKDTGQWFLDLDDFVNWLNTPGFIWIYGIPGSGKTVLSSTIIETVRAVCEVCPDRRIAMFYFDFQEAEKQEMKPFVRSLLRQLLAAESVVPEFVVKMHKTFKNSGQSPSVQDLESALVRVLEVSSKETYIILDTIDVFPQRSKSSKRRELLKFLQNMAKNHNSKLHILAASRDETDIREVFQTISGHFICLKAAKIDYDILKYVKSCLVDGRSLPQFR